MVVLLTATISCSQAMGIIHRLTGVVGLTEFQKTEIVQEIRKVIPFCPIIVKQDGK
jgi:hypothetical protein